MRSIILLFLCSTLVFARRMDLVLPVDSVTSDHLERSIRFGSVADTFQVAFESKMWAFTQRRNSAQTLYEGVEIGKDTLASTAILYGLKLYNITDSTFLLSGKRQVKREGRYYEEVGSIDSIVVYKKSINKVTLGKTKRQRLLFPVIAISIFGALAAFSSYKNKD